MTFKNTLKLCLLTLLALVFAGCGQDATDDYGKNKVKVRLSLGDYVPREIRGLATAEEENVKTLDVIFFDATGNLHTFDGHKVFSYDVANPKPSEWVDGTVAKRTVYVDLKRDQVQGKTAVALLNLPPAIKTEIENGTLATLMQLKQKMAQEIATATEIATPLIMVGEATVPAAIAEDYTIPVEVKRIVAKMQVNVYYEWEKLVLPKAGAKPEEKSFYTYKQLDGKSYVGVDEAISKRVDGSETEMPVPATATPRQSEISAVYINEYKITDRLTTPAPYILLKVPAILGEDNDLTRLFPPPAGGDFSKTPVYNYYKVVLPEQILRNCFYKVHARILGPGAPTPDGAPIIKFQVQVLPWSPEITVPGA